MKKQNPPHQKKPNFSSGDLVFRYHYLLDLALLPEGSITGCFPHEDLHLVCIRHV